MDDDTRFKTVLNGDAHMVWVTGRELAYNDDAGLGGLIRARSGNNRALIDRKAEACRAAKRFVAVLDNRPNVDFSDEELSALHDLMSALEWTV